MNLWLKLMQVIWIIFLDSSIYKFKILKVSYH